MFFDGGAPDMPAFRAKFEKALRAVASVRPEVRVELDDTGMSMRPSNVIRLTSVQARPRM